MAWTGIQSDQLRWMVGHQLVSIRRFASPKPLPSSSDWHVKKSERTQGVRTNWSTATRATVAVVVEAWTSVRALCLAGVC